MTGQNPSEQLKAILQNFEKNIESINELMILDALIQKICVTALQNSIDIIKKAGYADKHSCLIPLQNNLKSMEKIRDNESLGQYYEVVFNQAVVLLVSYFASTLQDLFSVALTAKIAQKSLGAIANEEIKVSIAELYGLDFSSIPQSVAELFITKKDISFQDMQSVARAFKDYIGFEPVKNIDVHNIILGQACRHAIVHCGANVNEKTIGQISNAIPRNVKLELNKGQKIIFTPDEVRKIGDSMKRYSANLIKTTCDVLDK